MNRWYAIIVVMRGAESQPSGKSFSFVGARVPVTCGALHARIAHIIAGFARRGSTFGCFRKCSARGLVMRASDGGVQMKRASCDGRNDLGENIEQILFRWK